MMMMMMMMMIIIIEFTSFTVLYDFNIVFIDQIYIVQGTVILINLHVTIKNMMAY
jgi:hypothetical protein